MPVSSAAGHGPGDNCIHEAVLDSLSIQVAVIDRRGCIRANNTQWKLHFPSNTGGRARQLMESGAYLEACESACVEIVDVSAECRAEMHNFLAALRAMLAGTVPEYTTEYQIPGARDWFRVRLRRCTSGNGDIIIQRENITAERLAGLNAEAALRAERELAEQGIQLKRLALVAERTQNGVLVLDPDGRIVWLNEGFTRMTGYTSDDAVGNFPMALLKSPNTDPVVADAIRMAARTRSAHRCEVLNRGKDGREYWIDLSFQPIYEGSVHTGWISIEHDITEQVKLRQQLIESEARLRATVESAELGIYEADLSKSVVRLGAGWTRLFGMPAADGDHAIDEYWERVYPDDRERVRLGSMEGATRGDALFHIEYRMFHEDGRLLWVHDAARVVRRDSAGRPQHVVGVVTDITRRKEVEQQFQSSAERLALAAAAADIAVWDHDLRTGTTYWDARMREIHGLGADANLNAVDPDTMGRLCHPDDRARLSAEIGAALASSDSFKSEFRVVRPNGDIRHVDVRAVIRHDVQHQAQRIIGITMDVTDRVQLALERQQAQRLQAIGQLAAGIAHEINTPIQYIGDNTRFIKDSVGELMGLLDRVGTMPVPSAEEMQALFASVDADYLRREIPQAIDQSLDGLSRVAGIVRAMRDFSHPATERTLHDLNRAIGSTITVATNEWKYVAEVVTDFDASLPMVPVMPGEFNQMILNMIVNASHAIAASVRNGSKGVIRIATSHDGEYARIRIADNGSGMKPETVERIFDPFYTTKPVGMGTGQGLAMAHNFVTRHGGRIEVESTFGVGTEFSIRLPLQVPAAMARSA